MQTPATATPQPSFRDLSPAILATLQTALENAIPAAADDGANRNRAALPPPLLSRDTALWAEKLLRYCEINQSSLRRRAKEKWHADAPKNAGQIALLFATYYRAMGDLRYLNAALKLADASWVTQPPTLRPQLESAIAALEK